MAALPFANFGLNAPPPLVYDPAKEQDYLAVTAYTPEPSEKAMIWFPPDEHAMVHAMLMNAFEQSATAKLGDIEPLPYELLREICLALDIESLFRFKQVNRSARVTVTSLWEYKKIAEHAPGALCAILRTGIGQYFTIKDLAKVFRTQTCTSCGLFGGFIQLLEFSRYCKACIERDGFLNPLSGGALRAHGMTLKTAKSKFPVMTSVVGMYTLQYIPYNKRMCLMRAEHVHGVAEERGTEKGAELRNLFCTQSEWRKLGPIDKARMWDNLRSKYGRIASHAYNYMTCTVLPYYDIAEDKVDRGLGCIGCYVAFYGPGGNHWRWRICQMIRFGRSYSRTEFLEHLQQCPGAQRCWAMSEGGTKTYKVPSAPFLKLLLERACPRFPSDVLGKIRN